MYPGSQHFLHMPTIKHNENNSGKKYKIYEFRIYTLASGYTGDLELLASLFKCFEKNFTSNPASPQEQAEECARNIGLFGVTIENPKYSFSFYPPSRIAKVEFNEVEQKC